MQLFRLIFDSMHSMSPPPPPITPTTTTTTPTTTGTGTILHSPLTIILTPSPAPLPQSTSPPVPPPLRQQSQTIPNNLRSDILNLNNNFEQSTQQQLTQQQIRPKRSFTIESLITPDGKEKTLKLLEKECDDEHDIIKSHQKSFLLSHQQQQHLLHQHHQQQQQQQQQHSSTLNHHTHLRLRPPSINSSTIPFLQYPHPVTTLGYDLTVHPLLMMATAPVAALNGLQTNYFNQNIYPTINLQQQQQHHPSQQLNFHLNQHPHQLPQQQQQHQQHHHLHHHHLHHPNSNNNTDLSRIGNSALRTI